MESSYVLILLVLLIIVLVGIVFFGYRQLTQMVMLVNQHSSAIDSLRNFINRLLSAPPPDEMMFHSPMMQDIERTLHQGVAGSRSGGEEDDHELTEEEKNIEEQIEKEEAASNVETSSPVGVQPVQPEQPASSSSISLPPPPSQQSSEEVKDTFAKDIVIQPEGIVIQTSPIDEAKEEKKEEKPAPVDEIKNIEIKQKESKGGNKQRFPPTSAKDLMVGTTENFEGKLYVVYEQNNGIKKWKLAK